MLADWLQGTHMYTLYNTTYGLNPGTLFAIGFTSSAVFGTFLGLYVDRYGRRLGCITFCLLEVVINVLEHYNNWYVLAVGSKMVSYIDKPIGAKTVTMSRLVLTKPIVFKLLLCAVS